MKTFFYTLHIAATKQVKTGSLKASSKLEAEAILERDFGFCDYLKVELI